MTSRVVRPQRTRAHRPCCQSPDICIRLMLCSRLPHCYRSRSQSRSRPSISLRTNLKPSSFLPLQLGMFQQRLLGGAQVILFDRLDLRRPLTSSPVIPEISLRSLRSLFIA